MIDTAEQPLSLIDVKFGLWSLRCRSSIVANGDWVRVQREEVKAGGRAGPNAHAWDVREPFADRRVIPSLLRVRAEGGLNFAIQRGASVGRMRAPRPLAGPGRDWSD